MLVEAREEATKKDCILGQGFVMIFFPNIYMCLKEKRALDRVLKQRTKRGAARGMGSFFLVFFSMEALVP